MQMNKPLIIAHRGDHKAGQLENSLPAFASAIQLGADGLEVDVQLHEGRLILKHNIDAHMPPVVDDFCIILSVGERDQLPRFVID
ncbi:glycerophosphodiester phosphodiesterase family protein [Weissella confusa]|uniref:glycerophosphodiester phosphodiesterase family protein n=1 Tax=Weissella confusa TaxID=1583 RepID=UPI001AEC06D8|nr:glycerophosphodiester phosphodiesterase family protein [Weissella confusa]